jgi:hypothetical protein
MGQDAPYAGDWGQTYAKTLNEGESEILAAVSEPSLIFERDFMVSVNEADTTGGILQQVAGQGDVYFWKCISPPIGTLFQLGTFGWAQGQGMRLWCATGSLIFSWRERYRMIP